MYFAIIGKNQTISMHELSYVQPENIQHIGYNIVTFDTKYPNRLSTLGGLIKRWHIIDPEEIPNLFNEKRIIGTADDKRWLSLKKTYNLKRYKKVDIGHTDRDIKKKGIELIKISPKQIGVVQERQNIPLYEVVDFDKPARSMHVGMMPSKLTHILINIGLAHTSMDQTIDNIYDPFCGSGTTLMLANAAGRHCIGSDIDTTMAIKNIQRRKKNTHASDKNIFVFQHDITQKLSDPKLKNVKLIVTEGWLWPNITKQSTSKDLQNAHQQVSTLNQHLLHTVQDFFQNNLPTIVITVPYYEQGHNSIATQLISDGQSLGRRGEIVQEIYKRDKQHIGRQIVILHN